MANREYARNSVDCQSFLANRWPRLWTYSNQTSLKMFKYLIRGNGLFDQENLTVFDMGFGSGSMLFVFKRATTITGVELSKIAVEQAKIIAGKDKCKSSKFGIVQNDGSYSKEWISEYDDVIVSYVLEHHEDPVPAFRLLKSLNKPDGWACIFVPVNENPGDELNHFFLFTEQLLQEKLEAEGLEIVSIWSRQTLMWLLVPLFEVKQQNSCLIVSVFSKIINALLSPLQHVVLRLFDRGLAIFTTRNTRCFALARKTIRPTASKISDINIF